MVTNQKWHFRVRKKCSWCLKLVILSQEVAPFVCRKYKLRGIKWNPNSPKTALWTYRIHSQNSSSIIFRKENKQKNPINKTVLLPLSHERDVLNPQNSVPRFSLHSFYLFIKKWEQHRFRTVAVLIPAVTVPSFCTVNIFLYLLWDYTRAQWTFSGLSTIFSFRFWFSSQVFLRWRPDLLDVLDLPLKFLFPLSHVHTTEFQYIWLVLYALI